MRRLSFSVIVLLLGGFAAVLFVSPTRPQTKVLVVGALSASRRPSFRPDFVSATTVPPTTVPVIPVPPLKVERIVPAPPKVTPTSRPAAPARASPPSGSTQIVPVGNDILGCIMRHETGGRNVWNAGGSGASGYFQFMQGTFDHYSGLTGPAINYSYAVQAAAVLKAFASGGGHAWAGSGCPGT